MRRPSENRNLQDSDPPASRFEWATVGVMIAGFVALQGKAISHASFMGQDYPMHVALTNKLVTGSDWWVALNFTTRPFAYWVGWLGHYVSDGKATFVCAAWVATVMAALALFVFYLAIRRVVAARLLRLAALAFIAFLPVTVVTSVVFASDTYAILPFVLAGFFLIKAVRAERMRTAVVAAGLVAGALIWGNLVKLPFAILAVAAVLLLFVLAWGRVLPWRRASLLAVIVGLTTAAGWQIIQSANKTYLKEASPVVHVFNWAGTGELTWPSLVGLKCSDARVLDAPSYWATETINGAVVQPMIVSNGFSYPALLHLGVFTDVLDFTHRGGYDRTKPRPEERQRHARWAVRSALIFSLATLVAMVGFVLRSTWCVVRRAVPVSIDVLIWGGLALAWYLPLVVTLPYVGGAYTFGYWLPRLVLPALWGFALVLFWSVDRLIAGRSPNWMRCVAAAVLAQSLLHIAVTWY